MTLRRILTLYCLRTYPLLAFFSLIILPSLSQLVCCLLLHVRMTAITPITAFPEAALTWYGRTCLLDMAK